MAQRKAPEVVKAGVNLRDPGYGFKADIWSAGVLFYLLLVGKWPFNGETGRILNAGLSSAEKMQTDAMVDQMLEKLEQQDLYQAVCEEELDFSPEAWEGRSPESLDFVVRCITAGPASTFRASGLHHPHPSLLPAEIHAAARSHVEAICPRGT